MSRIGFVLVCLAIFVGCASTPTKRPQAENAGEPDHSFHEQVQGNFK